MASLARIETVKPLVATDPKAARVNPPVGQVLVPRVSVRGDDAHVVHANPISELVVDVELHSKTVTRFCGRRRDN